MPANFWFFDTKLIKRPILNYIYPRLPAIEKNFQRGIEKQADIDQRKLTPPALPGRKAPRKSPAYSVTSVAVWRSTTGGKRRENTAALNLFSKKKLFVTAGESSK